nr:hypothetical protein [Paraburkholderia tropica]
MAFEAEIQLRAVDVRVNVSARHEELLAHLARAHARHARDEVARLRVGPMVGDFVDDFVRARGGQRVERGGVGVQTGEIAKPFLIVRIRTGHQTRLQIHVERTGFRPLHGASLPESVSMPKR